MKSLASIRSPFIRTLSALVVAALAVPAFGLVTKTPTPLDSKARMDPAFHQSVGGEPLAAVIDRLPNADALRGYLAAFGEQSLFVDPLSGRVTGAWGAGIPWIPGSGNALTLADVAWAMTGPKAEPGLPELEAIARKFMADQAAVFRIPAGVELTLNPVSSTRISPSFWSLWFDASWNGIPIQFGSVSFAVKHGNLVLWGTRNLDDVVGITLDAPLAAAEARQQVGAYIGGFLDGVDRFLDSPHRILFAERDGSRHGYRDVWEVAFERKTEGRYAGRIDARSGELLELEDTDRYAQTRGGVYPISNFAGSETTLPLGFADYGTNLYSDSGGTFFYTSGTVTSKLEGKYVRLSDDCGAISLAVSSAPGDIDFGKGSGTDCATPGYGGAGNTHASRSCYFHLNQIKQKGRTLLPYNGWLTEKLTANVNLGGSCNAGWDGTAVNFLRSGNGCGNTGEIAGVFLHEWGHGMDQMDGNGAQGSGEAMGDTVAMLQLRDSCIGPNFFTGPCDGYGNACTTCTGVREQDRLKHALAEILTPKTIISRCPSGYDVCGREVHCEGELAGNTVWDLAYRDLPARADLEVEDAWQLADKLWWESGPSRTAGYSCGNKTGPPWNNGCGTTTWYKTFLVADDDDGNLANGTPHASTIFAAFDRHGISCGVATDAANLDSTTCNPVGAVGTMNAIAGNNSVTVTWNPASGASVYRVLRNASGCNSGFLEVARVPASGAAVDYHVDTTASNGATWYYRLQPIGPNPDCPGPTSSCVFASPAAVAEARYRVGSAVQTADSGDGDLMPDNCETATVGFAVENSGTVPLTGVRVVDLVPGFAGVTVRTPVPIDLGSIPVGGTATGSFQYRLGDGATNATAGQALLFKIVVTANEAPSSMVGTFSFVAEQDRILQSSVVWSFETDLQGWTVVGGTFARTTLGGGQAGSYNVASSSGVTGACDQIRSPLIRPAAGATLAIGTRYSIENQSAGSWFDRANVGIFDPATGVRTRILPTAGRLYEATPSGGECLLKNQEGWAGTQNSWADSSGFDLSPWTGRDVQIDIVYATDAQVSGTGFRFDNVRLTSVQTYGADQHADLCSGCSAAPVIRTEPIDQTACEGGAVTFSVTALGATGYQWKKDGSPIGTALSATYSISSVAPGDAGAYSVDVTNGCGTTPSQGGDLTVIPAGNPVPASATGVSPADGAIGVAVATTLSWTPGANTGRIHLLMGTSTTVRLQAVLAGTATTFPVLLSPNTTYWWQLVSYPTSGTAAAVPSPLVSFTTGAAAIEATSVTPSLVDRWNATPVAMSVIGSGLSGGPAVSFSGPSATPGSFTPGTIGSTSIGGSFTPSATAHTGRYDVVLSDGGIPVAAALDALVVRAFADVAESDFYFDSSERMVTAGVMPSFTGASGPEFRATLKVTRGDMAEYLVKAWFWDLGQSVPVRDCYADFPDVTCDHPQRLYVEWAKDLGITLGGADGNFYPTNLVTRAEMAAFLNRLRYGGDASVPKCVGDPGWSDLAQIPSWSLPYINLLRSDRITAGCSASPLSYCPLGNVQRSDIATFLSRVVGEIALP
jgi:hypothetical protein